ncbi:glycodelin [Saccopteryx leptura]|uniref:glycodelin n=1 Tax=Saccopteryx leptura TaxID=249018 RepID=UPI00339CFB2A
MKCLLLALSVALVCGTQDVFVRQTGEDLDIQKMAGTWFSMAMAAGDRAPLEAAEAQLRMHIRELRPTAEDDLEITMHRWEDDTCVERKMTARKTGNPTEFQMEDMKDVKVHVLDTDYENYAFLCLENTTNAKLSPACQYLARTPTVDEMAVEQFKRALNVLSIHVQIIFAPRQMTERCYA